MSCSRCGGPLMTLPNGLFRCKLCGLFQHINEGGHQVPARLVVYPRVAKIKDMATEVDEDAVYVQKGEEPIAPDMIAFMHRLAVALTPISPDYKSEVRVGLLKQRREYITELTKVFTGTGNEWQEWIDKTRTYTGLHWTEFTKLIIDSLTGLHSDEAKQLREQFEQLLSKGPMG